MNSFITEKKPCPVQTSQGFSIEYQQKYLYSKYNPSKNIETLISNLEILSGTIFLCNSPVLDHGIKSLLNKLQDNCILFFCEFDRELHDYIKHNSHYLNNERVFFLTPEELYDLPVFLNKKLHLFSNGKKIESGYYKRIKRIDFSSGIQFNNDLYNQLELACINSIRTFWTNRVTLTKFGKKYSRNVFRNLSILPDTTPISNYFESIEKPIIVCGAGLSLQNGIKDFISNKDKYFILCVDTAANFLIHNNIIPDGIFIEEAQNIILESFFDVNKNNCHIFAGLSSISTLSHYIENSKNLSFFATEYIKADFYETLINHDFIESKNPPFGSVGLTTVYYALKFRKNENIPVYTYGLDFSFPKGITHVKNSIALKDRFKNSNKIAHILNFKSCFANNGISQLNNGLYTSIILQNYAKMFIENFSFQKNLFDSRDFGIPLNIKSKKPEISNTSSLYIKNNPFNPSIKLKIKEYINDEITALTELKNIFTNHYNCNLHKSEKEINREITDLLYNREYLYLHFIDGYQLSFSKDFLNRVRSEIDIFLKDFEIILKETD